MNKPGYKHTPLGWIPKDWETVRLDSVIDLINGKAFKPVEWEKSGLPIIRIQNLNDQGADFNYYSKRVEKRYYVNNGDLLFAWSGTKGVSFGARRWEKGLAILNQHIFKISLKGESLLYEYTLPVLKFVQSNIEEKAHGFKSSFVHVKKHDLDRIILPLPPPLEQRRIAVILSAWDTAIAKEQRLIDALQTRHRALMQQLLSGKKRLKGFRKEWKEVRLGELFDRVTRKNSEGNTTVVTISAQRGFVMQTDFFNKTIASDITDDYFLVERGDFCYNKSYSNGYPWGAIKRLSQFQKAVVTTLYICFRIKNEKQSSAAFFEHFFEAGLLDKELMKIAHEGGRAHGLLNVTPDDFFQLKIPIPSLDEQIDIAQILGTSDQEIQTHRRRLAAMQQQKKGLMQVLLKGKVRVKTTGS